jgi:hypothetical protein
MHHQSRTIHLQRIGNECSFSRLIGVTPQAFNSYGRPPRLFHERVLGLSLCMYVSLNRHLKFTTSRLATIPHHRADCQYPIGDVLPGMRHYQEPRPGDQWQ